MARGYIKEYDGEQTSRFNISQNLTTIVLIMNI